MKTFTIEGQDHTIPDVKIIGDGDNEYMFQVEDGECAGFKFSIIDMKMDDKDEALMHFNIAAEKEENIDKIELFAGSYILWILSEQIRVSQLVDTLKSPREDIK